jgi:hypothetical protein
MVMAVAGFVVLVVAAARAYPGGTHFDHARVGHDFWRNTLCDLTRTVALDGSPNTPGAALAASALIVLALGLGAFFLALPRLFASSHARLARSVRTLGAVTVPLAIAVVLLPTDRFGRLHGVAIFFAGTTGLAAAGLALRALVPAARAPRAVVVCGVLAALLASLDFALYMTELLTAGPAQVAVAVLERLATLVLLAWMLAVARALPHVSVQGAARSHVPIVQPAAQCPSQLDGSWRARALQRGRACFAHSLRSLRRHS